MRLPPRGDRFPAWLALVGVLLGALLGAVPTLINNKEQIAAQDQRSQSEFMRDRRQAAYTQFVTDYAAMHRVFEQFRKEILLEPNGILRRSTNPDEPRRVQELLTTDERSYDELLEQARETYAKLRRSMVTCN